MKIKCMSFDSINVFSSILSRVFLLFVLFGFNTIKCDLPVHCRREAIDGMWTFRINKQIIQPSLTNPETSCGHGFPDRIETTVGDHDFSFDKYHDIRIHLASNYKVYENDKIVGSWTTVYDEGFILKYKNSVFTTFMKYYKLSEESSDYHSNCDKTMIGWYIPDEKKNDKNWNCFFGFKDSVKQSFNRKDNLFGIAKHTNTPIGSYKILDFMSLKENLELTVRSKISLKEQLDTVKYEDQKEVVDEINAMDLPWKAHIHNEFKGYSLLELSEKLGLKRKRSVSKLGDNTTPNNFSQVQKLAPKASNLRPTKANKSFFKKEGDETNFIQLLNREKTTNEVGVDDGKREQDSAFITSIQDIQKYLSIENKDIEETTLAKNWDWRNVGGVSYIPRLRKQESCGSCYIFSTVSSLESRLRIITNNNDKTEFSRQFPLSCNFYTEGCEGGYPILVGKFFSEFEIIPEECFEYQAENLPCSNVCDYTKYKKKYKVSKYEYLGGFYGATSEVEMMKEIRARGPIPGNISVPWSFSYYSTGIYTHEQVLKKNTGSISKSTLFDKKISWEKVDHSILIIGWGEENGVKYWTCMNTWGEQWGENGFFRILRGENECSIESMGDCFRISVSDR